MSENEKKSLHGLPLVSHARPPGSGVQSQPKDAISSKTKTSSETKTDRTTQTTAETDPSDDLKTDAKPAQILSTTNTSESDAIVKSTRRTSKLSLKTGQIKTEPTGQSSLQDTTATSSVPKKTAEPSIKDSGESTAATPSRKPRIQLKTSAKSDDVHQEKQTPQTIEKHSKDIHDTSAENIPIDPETTPASTPTTDDSSITKPAAVSYDVGTPEQDHNDQDSNSKFSDDPPDNDSNDYELNKKLNHIRANIIEFINRHGHKSKVVIEPIGSLGVRLALIGEDGVLGDQVVDKREDAEKIIESIDTLTIARWDRAVVSIVKIMPYHWLKMAGWVARSHHFPKYKKKHS